MTDRQTILFTNLFQHDTTGMVFVVAAGPGPDSSLSVCTGGVWWTEYGAGPDGNFPGH